MKLNNNEIKEVEIKEKNKADTSFWNKIISFYKNNNMKVLYGTLCVLIAILVITAFVTGAYKNTDIPDNNEEVTTGNIETAGEDTSAKEEVLQPESEDSEIFMLIKNYYNSKQNANMEELGKYVDNLENINQELLIKESRYIEEYQNIKCYVAGNEDEKSKIILVDVDYKFFGIDTPAPCNVWIYIVKGEDNKFYVHNMEVNNEINVYINNLIKKPAVAGILNNTEERFNISCENDSELKHIWELVSKNDSQDNLETSASETKAAETTTKKETATTAKK